MKLSRIFLEILRSAGVQYIFGTPGSTERGLIDALDEFNGIKYLLALHESVAAGMADGYARASGIPGIVSVHTPVGTANALGMVINAFSDYSPVVYTAGIKDSRSLGGGVFCDSPFCITDLMRQYTRKAWQCLEPQNINRDTATVLREALIPPQGPSFLAVPENFWEVDLETPDSAPSINSHLESVATGDEIKRAAELISKSRHPIILSGNEVGKSSAGKLVVELAEKIKSPVFCEERLAWAYLNFPNNHPLYCGCFNPKFELVAKADLLIGVGARMFMNPTYMDSRHISSETKIIQFDPDVRKISSQYEADVGLPGSTKENLALLLTQLNNNEFFSMNAVWQKHFENHRNKRESLLENNTRILTNSGFINAIQLANALSKKVAKDAIIVNEGIRSGFYFQDHFELPLTRSYYGNTGGCLGWGTPAAMGIKLAHPKRQVISLVGDGSFLFSNQALWTAAHYGIDVKVVVCNNKGYMAVKSSLKNFRNNISSPGNVLVGDIVKPCVDFTHLSKSFGVPCLRAETSEELNQKIEHFIETPGPSLLEVIIDKKGLGAIPD
jgi:benzoylformate decarboxylase